MQSGELLCSMLGKVMAFNAAPRRCSARNQPYLLFSDIKFMCFAERLPSETKSSMSPSAPAFVPGLFRRQSVPAISSQSSALAFAPSQRSNGSQTLLQALPETRNAMADEATSESHPKLGKAWSCMVACMILSSC